MIKKILVGIGGTPYTTVAVQRALELASLHGAKVTGVTVVDTNRLQRVGPVPVGGMEYARRLAEKRIAATQERVNEALAAFEAACDENAVSCPLERETGDPFDLMISHARYHDLTVFGLRSLFDYGLTTDPRNVLTRLVTGGVRPILAVSKNYRPLRKALLAYSGSMESAKAMRRFVQMRLWPDVHLEIVNFSGNTAEGEALLAAAAEYCRAHNFDTVTRQLSGDPRGGVLEYAQQTDADIIVMGNSVRNLLIRKILGSTVLYTIENADRPLFLAQ
jgi:nucleotide-binding universal stress UspA family protein